MLASKTSDAVISFIFQWFIFIDNQRMGFFFILYNGLIAVRV